MHASEPLNYGISGTALWGGAGGHARKSSMSLHHQGHKHREGRFCKNRSLQKVGIESSSLENLLQALQDVEKGNCRAHKSQFC